MIPRTSSRLAWSLFGLVVGMLLAALVFTLMQQVPPDQVPFVFVIPVLVVAFAWVGTLIASRHATNAIGWLFIGVALLWAASALAGGFASYSEAHGGTSSWIARTSDWLSTWVFLPALFVPVTYLLLLFPDGRPPSRRWRIVGWATAVAIACITASGMFRPGPSEDAVFLQTNPYAIGSDALWNVVGPIGFLLGTASMIASATAVVVRLRRARGEERQQLSWLAFAAVSVAVILVLLSVAQGILGEDATIVVPALTIGAILLIPIATGLAILKRRLYDVDIVIRKTLVYGVLAVFITLVYVALVVGIGAVIGSGDKPNVGLSILATAVVAVAFQPLRRRAQRLANRLVYGSRATPYEVLSDFSQRMAETYSADDVLQRMASILGEGTGAARAEVWLRVGSALRPAASWPAAEASPIETLALSGEEVPEIPRADRVAAVRHQGELLGALAVTEKPGEALTPTEEKLLTDLAGQAGLVLRNARLTEELLARLDELKTSRQRLVAAQDEERRRLERNLHDGAQQQLVALAVKLGLVERLVEGDAAKATRVLAEAKAEVTEALDTLRDLARGIYPPLLADKGLTAALQAQARKSPIPVEVEPDGIGRYAQETEAAVYFCCLEALQNVAKYAGASRATVRLSSAGRVLSFEVTDDGTGFDPSGTPPGSGLTNMADRLAALDGSLEIRSAPGEGTTVAGLLPAEGREP